MPFSMMVLHRLFSRKIPLQEVKQKTIVTLQVRILNIKNVISNIKRDGGKAQCHHGRKVFLSAPASMTLETALALSLFIFAAVSLILPMKIMTTERRVQAGLEAIGEDFCRYAYIQEAVEKGNLVSIPGADDFAKGFCRNLSAGVAAGYAQVRVMEHIDTGNVTSVTMLRSAIREDGETFDLVLDYKIRMPFPVLGLGAVSRTARCCRRAWIGKEGKDEGAGGDGEKEEDEIVYVGKDSTRYHRDRGCHYLTNSLTAVSYDTVENSRNDSGKKYYACAVCGKSAASGSVVYIMPSGTSFHTTKNCTAIIAYVKAVRLSEVAYLGPCSYCSR